MKIIDFANKILTCFTTKFSELLPEVFGANCIEILCHHCMCTSPVPKLEVGRPGNEATSSCGLVATNVLLSCDCHAIIITDLVCKWE